MCRSMGGKKSSPRRRGDRGRKRAVIAVAHSQLTPIYEMLKDSTEYHDLGADYLDKLQRERIKRNLVSRLHRMGYQVNLTDLPANEAA